MATITTEARTVLARLELLQHGTTTRYDPAKGSRNSEAPLVPPGESDPPHERWRRTVKQSDGLDRADQARALVASGMSYRQAAAVIGVAHTTISRWLD
jgi:hypothetical protein